MVERCEWLSRTTYERSRTAPPHKIVEVIDLPHAEALAISQRIIAAAPRSIDCLVDLDAPLIPKNGPPRLFAFNPGGLPEESQNFLNWLVREEGVRPFIFTARPLAGRIAYFLNTEGKFLKRMLGALFQTDSDTKTSLFRQLLSAGLDPTEIYFPQGFRCWCFPLAKFSPPSALPLDSRTLFYLGDTLLDQRIFYRLLHQRKERGIDVRGDTFIKFPSAYPFGIL